MILEVEVVKVFLLVMVRFSGLIISAPILGSANFPATAKIGLAGLCSVLVTPTIGSLQQALPADAIAFSLLAVGELLIGLIIGFLITLVFAMIQVGGQIMDMLTGFALINVFNPAMESQVPIFGFFFFILAMLYMLVTGGHHLMIRALVASFDEAPLGGFVVHPEILRHLSTMGSSMFLNGLIIAAPVAGAMLLAYLTMGLLGRVVPQIQLFTVGFPVTIAVGLLMVAMVLRTYITVLDGMFFRMFRDLSSVVKAMG